MVRGKEQNEQTIRLMEELVRLQIEANKKLDEQTKATKDNSAG